jgi:hypothetical protein
MPRDVNGNYSLPAGNPVVTTTLISSVWANSTMSDLGTALTNSLDRTGASAGMTGQFKASDGAVGAPGWSFGSEPTSGLYRAGAGDFRFSIAGTDIFRFGSAGILFADGTVLLPSISFVADPNTGIYRIGADDLGVTTGGVKRIEVAADGRVTISASTGTASLVVTTPQNSGSILFQSQNTGVGFNASWVDTTAGLPRGFIGIGTGTVGAAAVTDFAISPGVSGSVVIGTANGGQIGTRFGPTGVVTIGPPISGVPLSVVGGGGYIQQWTDLTRTFGIYISGGNPQIGTVTNHAYGFFVNNGSPVLQITAGGVVQLLDTVSAQFYDVGFRAAPQNAQAGNYTCVALDSGKSVQFNGAGPFTCTIPSNASVPYILGTILLVINNTSSNMTVSSTDSLYLAGTGTVGARTLGVNGVMTLYKFGAAGWFCSGAGVS